MIDTKTINMRMVLAALGGSGVDRLYQQLGNELGVILTFHHISPEPESSFAPNTHLTIHPEFLQTVIDVLRKRDFEFVTMDEAQRRIANPQGGGRFAAFTVDDGYRDFAYHGVPILEREEVPFALYIATGLVDGTGILWWRGIERIVQDNDFVEFDGTDGRVTFEAKTLAQKRNAFCHLEWHLIETAQETDVRDVTRAWCERYDIDIDAMTRDAVMNWGELRTLASHPLCTIGGHGVDHLALARLDDRAMQDDLMRGADVLETQLGTRPQHLAFPFGYRNAAGVREFKAAAELDFKTAVTTRPGMIFSSHANHMTALPRVSVNGWYQHSRYFSPLATGLPTRIRQKFRQLDVS